MSRRNQHALIVLLLLTLVHGLIYAVLVPPWQAPDETGHLEYAWLLARLGRVPTRQDLSPSFERELLSSLYEWRYGRLTGRPLPNAMPWRLDELPAYVSAQRARTVLGGRFSLAYAWQALFLLPLRSQDLVSQLLAARFSSVLLNVGITWLAFLTFCELFPGRRGLAALATATLVLMPQHSFINSTVGDGTLAELAACGVFYCWARLLGRGWGVREAVGVLAGTTIGIASKNTAAFLIPLDLGLALWWLWRRRHRRWHWQQVVYLCLGLALLGSMVWLWARSPLGGRATQKLGQFLSLPDWAWSDRRGMTIWEGLLATYDSYWANFGWMALPIGERWYGAIALLSLIALWGWLVTRRQRAPGWAAGLMGGALGIAVATYVWAALLSREGDYYQFQGRYLFPVAVPLAFYLVGGLDRLWSGRGPEGTGRWLLSFLAILDAWCLAGYVLPYFYG